MIDHLCIIAVMALVAQGASASMQDGMILSWLAGPFSRLPLWLHKPTHTCPVCMVSVWGIPAALILCPGLDPAALPVYLLGAAGVNWILP